MVAPVVLATAACSFVPRSALRPALCHRGPDRFFSSQQGGDGEDSEVARLRRENAELKKRHNPEPEGSGIFDGIAKFFGKREETALEKQQNQMSKEIDEVFKGGGLMGSMLGAVAKGVVGMAGKVGAGVDASEGLGASFERSRGRHRPFETLKRAAHSSQRVR